MICDSLNLTLDVVATSRAEDGLGRARSDAFHLL
jgi:hypothetical protein